MKFRIGKREFWVKKTDTQHTPLRRYENTKVI